jgi:hypothetical protein
LRESGWGSDVRVVIDTNRLRSSELMAFLMVSSDNRVVVDEWLAVETYKQQDPAGVIESYRVLSGFAGQVVILRNTTNAAREAHVPGAIVNIEETRGFHAFANAMARANAGDPLVLAQISERRGWALEQIALMEAQLPDSAIIMAVVRGMMADEQWSKFARGEAFSPRMRDTFTEAVVRVTGLLCDLHPLRIDLPEPPQLYEQFTFRLALALMIHLYNLAKDGARTRSRAQAVNDRIDVFHIAYATYFNGLMTSDGRCAYTHAATRAALRGVGATLLDDYQDAMQDRVAAFIDERRLLAGKGPVGRATF